METKFKEIEVFEKVAQQRIFVEAKFCTLEVKSHGHLL
jgi:hypothetical protein